MSNGVVYGHHVGVIIEFCGRVRLILFVFVFAEGALNVAPVFHSSTTKDGTPERRLHFDSRQLVHFCSSFYAHDVGVLSGAFAVRYPHAVNVYILVDFVAVVNVYKSVG